MDDASSETAIRIRTLDLPSSIFIRVMEQTTSRVLSCR